MTDKKKKSKKKQTGVGEITRLKMTLTTSTHAIADCSNWERGKKKDRQGACDRRPTSGQLVDFQEKKENNNKKVK